MEHQNGAPRIEQRPPHRRLRRRHVALLLIGAIAAIGWSERRSILTRVVDQRLADAGLPVRYRIDDLGPRRQRLVDVVVGDPARPDLVADWIETRTAIGLSGPYLSAVSVGNARVRARLENGRLSLGTLDPLLTGGDGTGPALPSLRLAIGQGRVDLATPAGPVLLAVSGRGRLDRDFRGVLAAVSPRLAIGECVAVGTRAALDLRVVPGQRQRVRLDGPIGMAGGRCGATRLAGLRSRITAMIRPDGSRGSSAQGTMEAGALVHPDGRARSLSGGFALAYGGGDRVAGRIALAAADVRGAGLTARRIAGEGGIAFADGRLRFDGGASVAGVDAGRHVPFLMTGEGTPVAPLLARASAALREAAGDVDGEAQFTLAVGGDSHLSLRRVRLHGRGGAYATLEPQDSAVAAVEWWRDAGRDESAGSRTAIAARLAVGGGRLPTVRARVTRSSEDAPWRVAARIAPYRAGNASLALAPVEASFSPDGTARVRTRMMLSGPFGDGRVEALVVPIDLRRSRTGALLLGSGCVPLAFRRLSVGGLALDPATLRLCPDDGALVRVAGGQVDGAARLGATTLAGRLGSTPLALAIDGGTVRLRGAAFALEGVEARLGEPERATRLAAERLDGTIRDGIVSGDFAGAGGLIANVPLLLSAGAGEWRFAGGAVALTGAAQVADADPEPRFRPMAARDIDFRLDGGRIAATGTLHEPTTGMSVADVRIAHELAAGRGTAAIDVPDLAFTEGFQPDLLTPLTFGVIAEVRGRMDGAARIAWGPDGVVSRGDFGTAGMDLAAAFGPVTGIAGRVRFDDLLALHTPPGQVATVRTVNPGIAVENGMVRYQLLGGTRVQVEGARWPFAGGALTLDPTLLDFAAERSRRMTFRVDGADAGLFLQQFDFDNLNATGVFDGVLPMIFDESGGRIEDGLLVVREGGGTIAYVGELGREQLGIWGNVAFQALRSLRYRSLAIRLGGPLAGEMVTDVRFAGIAQGEGARSNFIIRRLQRLPFVFNVRIRAPFRGLIDSAASFYNPHRLIQRNLPALIEQQNRLAVPPTAPVSPSIQPAASETQR